MRATLPFIQERFDAFNQLCFGGSLPAIPLALSNARGFLGVCRFKKRRKLFGKWELYDFSIRISTRFDLPQDVIEDTLLHEMIHCYIGLNGLADTSAHGKVFRRMMKEINAKYGRHIRISHRLSQIEEGVSSPLVPVAENRMEMQVIARIRNDFPTKFGLPRQSSLAPSLRSKIVFEPSFRIPEALRGLEGFSHIWLIWGFSGNKAPVCEGLVERQVLQAEAPSLGLKGSVRALDEPVPPSSGVNWSPTVRPPRLGGNVRMGVFATRSPFRPNPIGLSSVRLEAIEEDGANGRVLIVSGADLMDGTPIYDIKPYLPGVDAHPDATDGFVGTHRQVLLDVEIAPALADALTANQLAALREILAQDPRPAYHAAKAAPDRIYGFLYAGRDIHFTVEGNLIKAY